MIIFKSEKQINCNYLLLCSLIVKVTCILYKNISYGNLVFTEQLFEVGESKQIETDYQKNEILSEQAFCSETMGESSLTG